MSIVETLPRHEAEYRTHDEMRWYEGYLVRIEQVTADFGKGPEERLRWVVQLDDDRGARDDGGDHETWIGTSLKINNNAKSLGGKYYKELTGEASVPNPVPLGRLFNPTPTRVKVMFQHDVEDGKTKERVAAFRKV